MTIVHGSKHQPISLTYRRQKKHEVNLFDRGYESFLKKMLHGIPIRIASSGGKVKNLVL